ncbi:acetyl-CoA carboxylase biotin carboxylase subunit family protein [Sinorhizobium meliloti]|uniref:ATP-grasp domain-containing protein n=1 Tax=Rhizobium meliloti TaxID=382 RepID=UPI0030CD0192
MTNSALILLEGHARGVGQLYVQAAKRLGLHPINFSTNPSEYDYLASEGVETIRVDTGDLAALIHECSRLQAIYGIAGITSSEEDVYATVGKLCRHFDLPGPNPASIERCCDKFTQRQLLEKAGIPIPAYRLAATAWELESAAAEIGLPVILKPAYGCGSRGVRLCRTIDELHEHTTYLLGGEHNWSSSPKILVEEFADGQHYSANIMGNEVVSIAAAGFGPPPHFVFREFSLPARLTDDEYKRVADILLSCLPALGLGWGPTNVELRWTKRGPVVIEVNPRLGGTPDPQMVHLAYGVDLITEHVKLATGGEWNVRRRHSHTAAARILVPDRDGTLDWVGDLSRATAVSGISEVKLYVESETPIVRKGDTRDWIGHVIAASHSGAETDAILQRAVGLIGWSITPFPRLGE